MNGIKFKFRTNFGELVSAKDIILNNNYEWQIGFSLNNDGIIVDVGANIGLYSLKAAKNKLSKVYSFEPDPDVYNILKLNKAINNLTNISIFNEALGSKICSIGFNKHNQSIMSYNDESSKDSVRMNTLDNFVKSFSIEAIDIMKIDVEGYEYEVIQGGLNSLNIIKRIVLEYHSNNLLHKITKLLDKNSFLRISASSYYPNMGYAYYINNLLV